MCFGHMCHVVELGVTKATDLMCALKLPMDGQEKNLDQPTRVLQCAAVYQIEILVFARTAESVFLVNC